MSLYLKKLSKVEVGTGIVSLYNDSKCLKEYNIVKNKVKS